MSPIAAYEYNSRLCPLVPIPVYLKCQNNAVQVCLAPGQGNAVRVSRKYAAAVQFRSQILGKLKFQGAINPIRSTKFLSTLSVNLDGL